MDGVTLSTHPAPESVAATTQVRAALAAGFSGETETALNARLLGGLIDALAASGVEDVTIALVIGDKRAPVTIDSVVNEMMTASACLMPMTTTAA
jgi:predicted histidine transporter YuiF (NhaC family)